MTTLMTRKFPHYKQFDTMDCGPTCLRIIAKHYGKNISLQKLSDKRDSSREGLSLLCISDAAESIGFRTLADRISSEQLQADVTTPFIAHWRQNLFIGVYAFKKDTVYVSDPAHD